MSSTFIKVCAAVALIPTRAIAQDQTTPDAPPETGDDAFPGTIVLSAPDNPIAEDGISVTRESLVPSNPVDLSEVFMAEPSIPVGGSIPISQKVYVNGIEENNLAISIDGARQNSKVFHHNADTAQRQQGPPRLAGALYPDLRQIARIRASTAVSQVVRSCASTVMRPCCNGNSRATRDNRGDVPAPFGWISVLIPCFGRSSDTSHRIGLPAMSWTTFRIEIIGTNL
nr:hypothetical protein [Tateyamaria omphalii]